jgi:hypothetical protein
VTKPFKLYEPDPFSTSRNMLTQANAESKSRNSRTLPPPPPGAVACELDQRIAELRRTAASILANANDLETIRDAMRGAL